jgi:hypothetical protein
MAKKPRTTTRTGKKIDPKTGKVKAPKVGQIIPAGNGLVKLATAEDIGTEEKPGPAVIAARTTNLPATPAESTPRRAKQDVRVVGRNTIAPYQKGFAVPYPRVKAAVDAALGHLTTMATNHRDSKEHKEAAETFHLIHANIGQMSPGLHTLLKQAHHEITNPGAKSGEVLAGVHKGIGIIMNAGKKAYHENLERSQAGRERKAE